MPTVSVAVSPEAAETSPRGGGPLPLRCRGDLKQQRRQIGDDEYLVIKDPLRLSYFLYPEEDGFVLGLLDGRRSFEAVQAAFEERFGHSLTPEVFQRKATLFLRDGLVTVAATDQGERLFQAGRRQRRNRLTQWLANPLAIRLPGQDFSPLLRAMTPWTRWLVKPWVVGVIFLIAFSALTLVVTHPQEFFRRLPLATDFFSGQNVVWLFLCIAVIKIVHELAHAVTCHQLGAECHEIGVMFLVFMPCLYCDVSDAWMLPGKWQRIAIASAGILAEMFLAGIFTFVWWASEPGFLNNLSLNVMFICGIGSLLFNGNPLLRYDGYFILADWLDIPNLWSRSRKVLNRALLRWGWGARGLEPLEPLLYRRRWLLGGYGLLSTVYRILLVFAILFFVFSVLSLYHLQVLGVALCGLFLYGLLVSPVLKHVGEAEWMVRQGNLTPWRFWFRGGLAAVLGIALFAVPLPCRVTVPAYLELANAERVYVATPGRLEWAVAEGQAVGAGDEVARVENLDLRLEQARVAGELRQAQSRLASLEALRGWDVSFGNQIPAEREVVGELTGRLRQLNQQVERLSVRTSRSGTVIPPRPVPTSQEDPGELPAWSGSPLEEFNRNAFLEKGTLLCLVGTPGQFEVFALVHQDIVDLVEAGQSARVQISGSPERRFAAHVRQLAPLDEFELPPDLADLVAHRFEIELFNRRADSGALYLARIEFDVPQEMATHFESAKVRITVAPRSLGSRILRYLKRTFASLSE